MSQHIIDFFSPIIPANDFHRNFKQMIKPQAANLRAGFTKWAEGFVDRDNKIVKEFQSSYNSVFWEIFLHALFKELSLNPSYDFISPDYCIQFEEKKILVEAVISNNAKDALPEYAIKYPDDLKLKNALKFNSAAILRYANSIQSKYHKYVNNYSKLEHVNGKPFIIALQSFAQPAFFLEYDRAIIPTLYGLYVDEFNEYNGEIAYSHGVNVKRMQTIKKPNGSDVPLGFFTTDNMKEVSAILFSCTATYSKLAALSPKGAGEILFSSLINDEDEYPHFFPMVPHDQYYERIQDGVCILHNPFAENPLPEELFREIGINHYTYLPGEDLFLREKNRHFLVTRTANFFTPRIVSTENKKNVCQKDIKKQKEKQKKQDRRVNRRRRKGK